MAVDLAGPPFHFTPDYGLSLTMPQFLFCWLRAGDMLADEKLEHFYLTVYAIGAAMSKDGQKVIKQVANLLTGGPMTEQQLFDDLSDSQQTVLFGTKKKRARQREHPTNPD